MVYLLSPRKYGPGGRYFDQGDIGRHGIAIMATRENLEFETTIESDCAALNDIVSWFDQGGDRNTLHARP